MKTPTKDITPNLSILRKVLFWDTNFDKIDWIKYSKAVIRRVNERGNEEEMQEIIRFYGAEKVEEAIRTDMRKPYTVYALQHRK